jgi:hypothetical protein
VVELRRIWGRSFVLAPKALSTLSDACFCGGEGLLLLVYDREFGEFCLPRLCIHVLLFFSKPGKVRLRQGNTVG